MPPSNWPATHTVFLPEVDAEHRSLCRLAVSLKKSLAKGLPAVELNETLRALLAEMEDHFTHEERMMRNAHYMLLPWHKDQHDTLRKRAKQCARRVQAGERDAAAELVPFLGRWLRDHTAVADSMMSAAIRNFQRASSRPAGLSRHAAAGR